MTNPVRAVAIDAAQAIEVAAESVLVTMANLDRPGPTIVYVNSAFERMTGWRRSEVLGKTPRVLQGPETDLSIFSDLRQRLSSERLWEGRAVNYRRDGTPFVMEWSIVPLYGPSGAVEQYLAVQRDVTERVEADRARTNLSRYFSPQLVKLLETRDEPLGLGHRQDVAVLFIDIIGFTPMAESMAPEQLIKLLRSFYQRMERVIFSHNGAIQGYMGDAILATFGVPETSGRDAIELTCLRPGHVGRGRALEPKAGVGRHLPGRRRYRHTLRPSGHRRCRLRAMHGVHHHRRYRQRREAPRAANAQAGLFPGGQQRCRARRSTPSCAPRSSAAAGKPAGQWAVSNPRPLAPRSGLGARPPGVSGGDRPPRAEPVAKLVQ